MGGGVGGIDKHQHANVNNKQIIYSSLDKLTQTIHLITVLPLVGGGARYVTPTSLLPTVVLCVMRSSHTMLLYHGSSRNERVEELWE